MTGPTPPAINKLKLPSAPGVKWIGLPENAVLHPPHRVQFAIRAKQDPVDRDLAETVETCAKRGVEMVRRIWPSHEALSQLGLGSVRSL